MNAIPRYQLLWGKTSQDKTQTHPLVCHMIDVAQVALTLWERALTDGLRTYFATSLGLECASAGQLIAFWAALHDLGKASPAFQRKHAPAETILKQAGLEFPRVFVDEATPHGTLSALKIEDVLCQETGMARRLARKIARAVGGHHGSWPTPADLQRIKSTEYGANAWDEVRRDLVRALLEVFRPPEVTRLGADRCGENAFLTLFSGLTSVADWIGSAEEYFGYVSAPVSLVEYAGRARQQAITALERLDWLGWQPPSAPAVFESLFPFPPRPMQQAVIELAGRLTEPALVLIEAPTGSGKTEAALYLADHWASVLSQQGFYVAMPTMATSNQMHIRVSEMLRRRYPEMALAPLLLHSQARWLPRQVVPQVREVDQTTQEDIAAMTWFLPTKRSLLAPFGVGTVDQALLSVLQTRHFFVRLFGLGCKTVIFDEVHAYDTYMSAIFRRLLAWLRAAGASVILLSATLPSRTRRELLAAYLGRDAATLPPVRYPAISWATATDAGVIELAAATERCVNLRWIGRAPREIVETLRDLLRDGGCAAVICNTVARSQEVYGELCQAAIVPAEDLILFHAQFPMAWREGIERRVLDRFGKNGVRPRKAVVVATQVVEQSLDLDFDVMITDLAPVDLVLQRAGRLHRHARTHRPDPLVKPCLILACDSEGEVPRFGNDIWVYEPYVLLRSYRALWGRAALALPGDTPSLIEAVYGNEALTDASPAFQEALQTAYEHMLKHQRKDEFEAEKRLVLSPHDEALLNQNSANLEEDSPEAHRAFQALTRLGPPNVAVVCLHRCGESLNTEPDGTGQVVDLGVAPDRETVYHLSRHTVNVSAHEAYEALSAQQPPAAWRDHPLLRNCRVAVFTDGVCHLEDSRCILKLDPRYGLSIDKERK